MSRTGRRPGSSGTRQAILDAARRHFAQRGYDAATIRGIAADAGVDPALVLHFFASKEGVFVAAMQWPFTPSETRARVLADGVDGAGPRLVELFIEIWDSSAARDPIIAMLRSASSNEQARTLLREFLQRELLGPMAAAIDRPDAELRATLVGAQLIGLAMARYVVGVEPLAGARPETVVAYVGPAVQRLLSAERLTADAPTTAATSARPPPGGSGRRPRTAR